MKYRKNEGMMLSPAEVFSIYLYGIKIQGGDGTAFSNESMRFYIQAAQKEIENYFNLNWSARSLIGKADVLPCGLLAIVSNTVSELPRQRAIIADGAIQSVGTDFLPYPMANGIY